ncbi:MAG: DUF429 domain-containing protein [Pseudomonadota bacterium]
MIIIGYDPGGAGSNGVAVLDVPAAGEARAWVCTKSYVDEAMAWILDRLGDAEPNAPGIDTYLSWSTGSSGWRPMDTLLKRQYPAVQLSVFASNSAQGSMAVQGMAMALRLRGLWGDRIRLNETHPKVAYYALAGVRYEFDDALVRWLLNRFNPPLNVPVRDDHQWDALFSAWATWMGETGKWNGNLMLDAHDLLLPAGEVTYYWP